MYRKLIQNPKLELQKWNGTVIMTVALSSFVAGWVIRFPFHHWNYFLFPGKMGPAQMCGIRHAKQYFGAAG